MIRVVDFIEQCLLQEKHFAMVRELKNFVGKDAYVTFLNNSEIVVVVENPIDTQASLKEEDKCFDVYHVQQHKYSAFPTKCGTIIGEKNSFIASLWLTEMFEPGISYEKHNERNISKLKEHIEEHNKQLVEHELD